LENHIHPPIYGGVRKSFPKVVESGINIGKILQLFVFFKIGNLKESFFLGLLIAIFNIFPVKYIVLLSHFLGEKYKIPRKENIFFPST